MIASYHNHSRWSDGKATIPELLAAGRTMGIEGLGVSDHWVLHPKGAQFKWAMPTNRLADYVSEVTSLRHKHPMLKLGLEVDWHPGNASNLRHVLDQYSWDYLIGSVHEIQMPWGDFMIDGSPAAWQPLTQEQRDAVHEQYWRNMRTLAESGVFDIVAHMDLPKKFAFYPAADLSREIDDALDAIATARTPAGGPLVVELNTAGWHKPCADAYPSIEILKQCRRRQIPVTISADAHQPEHLLRDFDRAARRLREAGYTAIARFDQRDMRLEPL